MEASRTQVSAKSKIVLCERLCNWDWRENAGRQLFRKSERNLNSILRCQAILMTGARLFFLPPYSPDLNPIEQAFSKLKHMLRKAKQRTIKSVWQSVGTSSEPSPPKNATTTSSMQDGAV
jgi:transposase